MSVTALIKQPRVFVSYSHDSPEHKERVLRLAEGLRADGVDCRLDQYEMSPDHGWSRWMMHQIESADFVLLVCTEAYTRRVEGREEPRKGLGATWEGALITNSIYESGGRNTKFIPIVLTHADVRNIPVFLRLFSYYDLSSPRGYEALYRHLTGQPEIVPGELGEVSRKLPRHVPVDENTEELVDRSPMSMGQGPASLRDSLRNRLLDDFYTAGPFIGQFGAGGGRKEDRHYQLPGGESLKIKPAYYLTYWGWRVTKRILSEVIGTWSAATLQGITQRFDSERWIRVELRDYERPTAPARTVETIRHTVRAAEILLLIEQGHATAAQVAWDLVREAPSLQNHDGGWKEFRVGDQASSLYSSLYVFHYLSTIMENSAWLRTVESFRGISEDISRLREGTEAYLEHQWKTNKWKFRSLPWEVNAPVTLAEFAPYASNVNFVHEVRESIRELLNPHGRLINPNIGDAFDAPEYVLTIRIAYALQCASQAQQVSESLLDGAKKWLRESYSVQRVLNTCDVAFLAELLLEDEA
jgi:hypothetical protein